MPMRKPSTSLLSANIKSLRLFRHVCRMLPFIIKVHELYLTFKLVLIGWSPSRPKDMLPIILGIMQLRRT